MTPVISVVMSVYNGERDLETSLASILAQTSVDLELVAVNDGSIDASGEVLNAWAARDPRLRVVHQDNRGLTRALRRGCAMARGEFIARQDSDDVSLPSRLQKQLECLRDHRTAVLVSCWTRFIGPTDEELFVIRRHEGPLEARRLLRATAVDRVQGIAGHGSAMFRRADYERVGGYHEEFWVAQDLDLWLRLTDRADAGVHFVLEILYEARFTPASLSMGHHQEQLALARIALDLAAVREGRGDESRLLAEAADIRRPVARANRAGAAGYYFMGRCLLTQGDQRARGYLLEAIRREPLHWRAWVGMLWALLLSLAPRKQPRA